MAAPVVRQATGAKTPSAGGFGVNVPALNAARAGDLLILIAQGVGIPDPVFMHPSGWNELDKRRPTHGQQIWWKRATGAAPVAQVRVSSRAQYVAVQLAISGAEAVGNIFGAVRYELFDHVVNSDRFNSQFAVYDDSLFLMMVQHAHGPNAGGWGGMQVSATMGSWQWITKDYTGIGIRNTEVLIAGITGIPKGTRISGTVRYGSSFGTVIRMVEVFAPHGSSGKKVMLI